MNSIFRSATVSWKSTTLGVLAFVAVLASNLFLELDSDPTTIANWNEVVAAAFVMFGGVVVKDGDKTTEDHRPIRTLKSNL